MRLGFYYHIPVIQRESQILMPGYLGRFLDTLAEYFGSLVLFLHAPNSGENCQFDYAIKSSKISLVPLPPRGSVPYRMLHKQQFTGLFKKHANDIDALILRGPSPLLPPIANCIKGLPTILMIVGDQIAGVDSLPQPGWRKELIRFWSIYNAKRQLHIARRSLVFVNSRELYRQFDKKVNHLVETRTTTLSAGDFYERKDTCVNKPVRLLYTGRMDPAKGLVDMIDALAILVDQGEDIVLDFVGWAETGSTILDEINRKAQEQKIPDRVICHGYKAVGPELFAYYKNADIYLIASRASEGFPRTIWEAMAHSLPVVATRVGSIPDFISDAAELVEPRNPMKIAAGISRLIQNKGLRQNYISRGLELARKNTLESQVGRMAINISDWVKIDEKSK